MKTKKQVKQFKYSENYKFERPINYSSTVALDNQRNQPTPDTSKEPSNSGLSFLASFLMVVLFVGVAHFGIYKAYSHVKEVAKKEVSTIDANLVSLSLVQFQIYLTTQSEKSSSLKTIFQFIENSIDFDATRYLRSFTENKEYFSITYSNIPDVACPIFQDKIAHSISSTPNFSLSVNNKIFDMSDKGLENSMGTELCDLSTKDKDNNIITIKLDKTNTEK